MPKELQQIYNDIFPIIKEKLSKKSQEEQAARLYKEYLYNNALPTLEFLQKNKSKEDVQSRIYTIICTERQLWSRFSPEDIRLILCQ